jgi:hypothetical protein
LWIHADSAVDGCLNILSEQGSGGKGRFAPIELLLGELPVLSQRAERAIGGAAGSKTVEEDQEAQCIVL